jgi:hypothetical protein
MLHGSTGGGPPLAEVAEIAQHADPKVTPSLYAGLTRAGTGSPT